MRHAADEARSIPEGNLELDSFDMPANFAAFTGDESLSEREAAKTSWTSPMEPLRPVLKSGTTTLHASSPWNNFFDFGKAGENSFANRERGDGVDFEGENKDDGSSKDELKDLQGREFEAAGGRVGYV